MIQTGESWSTDCRAGGSALRYWQELVSEMLVACDIRPASSDGFEATMTRRAFGAVTFQEVRSAGSHILRSREQIRRDRKDGYFIVQQRTGSVAVEQHGRTALIGPGDCILLSGKSPYSIRTDEHFTGLSMSVSPQLIQGWLPDPELMTARLIEGQLGWGRALSATLSNFLEGSAEDLVLPPSIVIDQILAQLAIALGPESSSTTRHQGSLFRRLGETLADRYREPDFDPTQLADAHGLSKRYVHLLFAKAGTTFGKELAKIRLENAKRLLEDRRFNCVDIMEIALRCGFRDSSGFSKRFRGQYGHPPSAYRRQVDVRRCAA